MSELLKWAEGYIKDVQDSRRRGYENTVPKYLQPTVIQTWLESLADAIIVESKLNGVGDKGKDGV